MAPILASLSSIIRQYGVTAASSGPTFVPATVTGGTSIVSGDDQYNVFASPGNLVVADGPITAEILIVSGGGGGGGYYYAGGGGGGGVVHGTEIELADGSYPVTVGDGGTKGAYNAKGTSGANSSFNSVTAIGGGGGGGYSSNGVGRPGGSSGGNSGYHSTPRVAVTAQPVPSDYNAYGNIAGGGGGYGGGGGGGAGGAGTNGSPYNGGPGGSGKAFPSFPAPVVAPGIPSPTRSAFTSAVGSTGLFGGGGGGAVYYYVGYSGGTAGPGGGGVGAGPYNGPNAGDGVEYTGGGGGGANSPPGGGVAGEGGHGVVMVKFTNAAPTPPTPPGPFSATGGTTYEPGNGYKYHVFNHPNSATFNVTGGPATVEVLIVAGGGSAGPGYNAGAGGGGVVHHTQFTVSEQNYAVTVGDGAPGPAAPNTNGGDSSFGGMTAKGGGGAGKYSSTNADPGGSGGGAEGTETTKGTGIQPTQNAPFTSETGFNQYGNPGGDGTTAGAYSAAGGGGAGAAGSPAGPGPGAGGKGGDGQAIPGFEYPLVGLSPITPQAYSPGNNQYGAGGGGWGYSTQYGGYRPQGGGGRGGNSVPSAEQAGLDGVGGGAGNSYYNAGDNSGGSGIVIIRYSV